MFHLTRLTRPVRALSSCGTLTMQRKGPFASNHRHHHHHTETVLNLWAGLPKGGFYKTNFKMFNVCGRGSWSHSVPNAKKDWVYRMLFFAYSCPDERGCHATWEPAHQERYSTFHPDHPMIYNGLRTFIWRPRFKSPLKLRVWWLFCGTSTLYWKSVTNSTAVSHCRSLLEEYREALGRGTQERAQSHILVTVTENLTWVLHKETHIPAAHVNTSSHRLV